MGSEMCIRDRDKEKLNNEVWAKIQEVAQRPDIIIKALTRASNPEKENLKLYKEEYEDLKGEIEKFEERRKRVIAMRTKGLITDDEVEEQLAMLKNEQKSNMARIKTIGAKVNFIEQTIRSGIDKEAVLKYTKLLRQSGIKLDISQKRRVIEAFVARIPVYEDGSFKVIFKFPIPTQYHTFEELMSLISSKHSKAQTHGAAARRHTG